MIKFGRTLGSNVVAFCSPIEICIEILNNTFPQSKRAGLRVLMPLRRALSNGANHNSVAASVSKLLVVLVAPTQREQSIDSYSITFGLHLLYPSLDREHLEPRTGKDVKLLSTVKTLLCRGSGDLGDSCTCCT